MSLLLIDDQGELWRGESRQLRAAFDSPFSGGEFVEYAVKNLGFVALNVYGRSIQVRLRPGFVTARAIAGLSDWLENSKLERMVLSRFEGGWRDEMVQAAQILARIDELVPYAGQNGLKDYLSKPLPIDRVGNEPVVAQVCENWPSLVEAHRTDTLVRLLRSVFKDRYVTVKSQPDRGKLTFHEFGEEMFPAYDVWRTCAVGAPIQEQPDRSYGRWISEVYSEAANGTMPHAAAVDAIINCPVRGRQRYRYRRLIFPLKTASDGQLLVGGSFDDPTIDLRIPSR